MYFIRKFFSFHEGLQADSIDKTYSRAIWAPERGLLCLKVSETNKILSRIWWQREILEFICIYLRFISPACHVAATLARVSSAFSPPSASTCTWAPRLEGDHHHHHPHPINNITIIIITNMINVYNECTLYIGSTLRRWPPSPPLWSRSTSSSYTHWHRHHNNNQCLHGAGVYRTIFFLEYPIK